MSNKLAQLVWLGMKSDGGMCNEWENFDVFCEWFITQYPQDKALIKTPGIYSPDSCWMLNNHKYNFYNPNGERVGSDNLSQLCKDNELSYKAMLCVNNGTAKTHNGWYKDIRNKPVEKVYYVFAPNHELIEIHNLSLHCRQCGLNYQSMLKVLNGSQQTHKGWYK